jgi:hypothetical protein
MSEVAQEIATETKCCKGKCGASFAAIVYRASTLQNPIALAVLLGVVILDLMFFFLSYIVALLSLFRLLFCISPVSSFSYFSSALPLAQSGASSRI